MSGSSNSMGLLAKNLLALDGLLLAQVDTRLHYVLASQGLASVLGCDVSTLIGKNTSKFGFTKRHQVSMHRVLETGRSGVLRNWTVTAAGQQTRTPAFWNWRLEALPDATGLLLWAQDVTERRLLESEVIKAAGEERQEVGQEIHDNVGQLLAALTMKSKALEFLLRDERSDGLPAARELRELTTEAISRLKYIARRLYPVGAEQGSLISGLQHLSEDVVETYHVTCQFTASAREPKLETVQCVHVYAIVKQIMRHAVQQAGARELSVTFVEEPDQFWVKVSHDGRAYKRLGNIQGYRLLTFHAHTIGGIISVVGESNKLVTFAGRFPRRIENHV